MKIWHILLLVNIDKDKSLSFTKEVVDFLKENNCIIYVEKKMQEKISDVLMINKDVDIDFCLLLGGDGSLLNKLHEYVEKDYAYFGINLGRVGCLLEATKKTYKEKLKAIFNFQYMVEERNTIFYQTTSSKGELVEGISFNEVAIERGKLFKMLLINMYVNGNNKTSFYADGVIVSTSTGSSAFNLSSGGPLLLPTAKNYVITPLCPQLRDITSLVVNDTDVITIDIKEDNPRQSYETTSPIVVIDGRTMIEINESSKLIIKKSPKKLKILKVDGQGSLFEPTFKVAMSNRNLLK